MYSRDSSVREKGKPALQTPSFSSTLLDEIYRSIDDGTVREERVKPKRNTNSSEEEAVQRARLVDKWMEKKAAAEENKKKLQLLQAASVVVNSNDVVSRRTRNSSSSSKSSMEKIDLEKKMALPTHYIENDPLFFSSGSTSSDSNSSLFSEHESVPAVIKSKTRTSCFKPPKPIRTSTKPEKRGGKTEEEDEDDVVIPASAKSRALKLYASLKKMKQPISPGVKLTTFLNSILSNSKNKSSTLKKQSIVEEEEENEGKKPTCSSATTFSRSCLNQQTPSSGKPRTVRFVQVINKESSIPAVKKQSGSEQSTSSVLKNRAVSDHQSTRPVSKSQVQNKPVSVMIESVKRRTEVEDEDAESDCSEDLFEIDHLKISNTGNGNVGTRFRDELPVFETTRIASSSSNSKPNRVVVKKASLSCNNKN